jgi:adenylate cyclase
VLGILEKAPSLGLKVDDREPRQSSDLWQRVLTGTQPQLRAGRRLLKHLPADVRCKLCGAPLEGPLSPLMRVIGKGRWPKNPTFCRSCFTFLVDNRGGAEIECSLMFADVRGSTTIAEGMRPAEVHALMNRFFRTAAKELVEHDAIVDRFVGDQAIGIFVPALAGERHAARAIEAAQALLAATGHGDGTPWIPVGAGVHTGTAFVGSIGSETQVDFTALGDTVNIAARLSSSAAIGETLVTLEAAAAADLDAARFTRRDVALKGKHSPTSVLVVPTAGLAGRRYG